MAALSHAARPRPQSVPMHAAKFGAKTAARLVPRRAAGLLHACRRRLECRGGQLTRDVGGAAARHAALGALVWWGI